jgi:hypothetical protein
VHRKEKGLNSYIVTYKQETMGEDTIDKSGYNEASFKMQRLHESQRRINYVTQDLLKYYHDLGGFGYIVKKAEIFNLGSEVWGKLDPKSKEKLEKYKEAINNYLEFCPIRVIICVPSVMGEKKTNSINMKNFKNFAKLLDVTHLYVNELLEEAGYSTFTIEGDDGDPYN